MTEIVDTEMPANATDAQAMAQRLFRFMCWTVALSVIVSAAFAPWRVTAGLLLGGLLSLLNYQWLRTSMSAAFAISATRGVKPKLRVARFILRYLIVAAVVFVTYQLDFVSLTATLIGLCSFVVAALIEAVMQVYFTFIHREET